MRGGSQGASCSRPDIYAGSACSDVRQGEGPSIDGAVDIESATASTLHGAITAALRHTHRRRTSCREQRIQRIIKKGLAAVE
jgi:hypothetical protein